MGGIRGESREYAMCEKRRLLGYITNLEILLYYDYEPPNKSVNMNE